MKKDKVYMKNILKLYNFISIIKATIILFVIISVIDLLNIPTTIYNFGNLPLLIGISILLLIITIELYIKDLLIVKIVNYFDFSNIVLLFTSILYSINYCFFEFPVNKYKLYCLIGMIFLAFFTLIFRRKYINDNYNENRSSIEKSNILDLKDLYDNNFPNSKNNLFFVDEKPVSYDLLERSEIINNLYMNIKECRTDKQYVLALTGDWGSGKTTIINNVKSLIEKSKDDDLIVIDTFDPWIYEDKNALFRAMFDSILSKIGINFSISEMNRFMNYLINVVFGATGLDKFRMRGNSDKEISRIKYMINSYLLENNKRILFIVDNIERANKEHILLLFKSISSIFNFDRIIYLVSYDKNRMKDIFEGPLKTDYEYIDKVIQQEIEIPKTSKDKMYEINYVVINNLLGLYGLSDGEKNSIDPIIREYSNSIKDLRELKRNINSIISNNFVNNNYLNKVDTFVVKYISLKNKELLDEIYNNRKFFISEDYSIYKSDYSYSNEEYNKETDECFKKIFSGKNNKYISLLSICFPNVKIYKDKYPISSTPQYRGTGTYISYDKTDYFRKSKEKRISNGKFFDLYFTSIKNEFLEIDININNFIKFINSGKKNQQEVYEEYSKILNLYKNFVQKYTLETFEYYIDDIKQNKLETAISIYNTVRYCDNTMIFLGLSSKSRAEILVSNVLCNLDESDFNKFLNYIKEDYKNLYIIKEIGYWLNPEHRSSKNSNAEYYNNFIKLYGDIKDNAINNNINIYADGNYGIYNIFCFWDDERFIKKISKSINKSTIFRFLCDMIGTSVGSGYGYSIRKADTEKIMGFDKLDKILEKAKPHNEKEQFILEVYKKRSSESDAFSSNVSRKEYFEYDLSE